ncbi:MAG: dihydropteroate synthase [Acidimicrobiales bacterium]
MPGPVLRLGDRQLRIDGTLVMGVVNASADSFSDGGEHADLDSRVELAGRLIAEGADMIDVGGQSAITGVAETPADLEADLVVPLIAAIHERWPGVLLSVDTYKPLVVEGSLRAGAAIVNDVSGLLQPEVARLCAAHGAGLVIMHTRSRPKERLVDPDLYDDVVADVASFLQRKVEEAMRLGVPEEALILDPGPDFAKTPAQTIDVVRGLAEFRALGRPLLLALSRKDFIGAILRKPPRQRLAGTMAAIAHVAVVPGNIVRVHDVAATRDVLAVVDVLTGRADVDPLYELPMSLRREPVPTPDG